MTYICTICDMELGRVITVLVYTPHPLISEHIQINSYYMF